ncbi:uncharacterized protein LOC116207840 isoform X2 [Punica granatum]|uniref:Uncharacterized protein LOC116207840 isoform X2 n=1 Tax=Punica granatum TaxID=22663 RepID=A0A6P8DWV2_PUNGR|nr:uncharacterized protein LOC116207840 isoform X2 [Punica granatum]
MSRSGGQKENHASSSDPLRDSMDESTAARTRPLSYEEIMKRRINKELSQNMKEEARGVEIIPRNDTIQDSSARLGSLRVGRETKRLSSVIERPVLEDNMRGSAREEKPLRGINGGTGHGLKELRYKEEHASMKESSHVTGNMKNRESRAGLRTNLMNESWSRDNRGETHSRIKNDDWHGGDTEDRRLRREIRNTGYRDETEQKLNTRAKNDERPRNSREERGQRNEPGNTGNRGEPDKKINSRSKNSERPRHNHRGPGNEQSETDKRINKRSKDDERPRNDSDDRARKAYSRDSMVNDRYTDRNEGKLDKENKKKYQNANDRDIRDKYAIKKPDLGRPRDSEVAEKKGQKQQLSGSRHEETKMKRKRSRSQDRGKDRVRRSLSLSPHKGVSSNGRKPGDSTSHSHKDRPAKQHHKDIERRKFASNGLGSHYRGHGGLTSGLGGYSPRKRKTENAIKTPSPTNRSPERKNAGWDIPPTGVKDSSSGSVADGPQLPNHQAVSLNVHELVSAVTAALNASKPLPGASSFLPAKTNASIDSIQLTESTRPMRRLYIENVPASASEKDVMEFLNNHLLSSGVNYIQGKQPCISCIIHKEKCQALVEFLTPEDASAALSFDGSSFSGCMLKIRRPKDFVEVVTGDIVEAAKSAPIVPLSNIVKDSPHKVFIGGISEVLSAEMRSEFFMLLQLIEIASAFGPLKAFYFDAKQDTLNRYAFLEYADLSVTPKACVGLNGMKLGGQVLTVVQALPDKSSSISEKQPTYVIPDHAKPLLQKPTQVIKLKNVFTPEDLLSLSKLEIGEVLEDLRLECARFGTVKSLNVVEREAFPVNNVEDARGVHNAEKSVETAGHGGKIFLETSEKVTDTENAEIKEVEVERDVGDREESDGALETESISHEENTNDVNRNEDDSSEQLDIKMDPKNPPDLPSPGSLDRPSLLADHVECPEGRGNLTSQIEEGKSSSGEAMEGLSAAQDGESEELDFELWRTFELGSVFVEYKRTEGSCIAAHALHGRIFDERVVMVEYVPLEHYLAKFPG